MSNTTQTNEISFKDTQNETNVNSSDNLEFDFSLCFDYYYSYCLC